SSIALAGKSEEKAGARSRNILQSVPGHGIRAHHRLALMLYYLHNLKNIWGAFNVFQYITFRAGGAIVTALLASLALGPAVITMLRRHKIEQIQRADGPSSHMHKQGTPTMGGLLIFAAVLISSLLWMRPDNRFTWIMVGVMVALTAVGFWDDYLKLILK